METKPGWKTSEFWLHIVAAMAITALTAFDPVKAGIPPLAVAAFQLAAPLALAWLAKNYGDSRTAVKVGQQQLETARMLKGAVESANPS